MANFIRLFLIALLFSYCSSNKSTSSSPSTAKKRIVHLNDTLKARYRVPDEADSVHWVGSQYVPITARREFTPDPLEGMWVLDSMNGQKVPNPTGLNTEKISDGELGKTQESNNSNNGTLESPGLSESETDLESRRITPPQGSKFHLPEKPRISFFGGNETFSGFTGCNKFSGRFHITAPNKLQLSNAAPSTKMVCIGDYNEEDFIKALHQVNGFRAQGNSLALLSGTNPILVFTRTNMK